MGDNADDGPLDFSLKRPSPSSSTGSGQSSNSDAERVPPFMRSPMSTAVFPRPHQSPSPITIKPDNDDDDEKIGQPQLGKNLPTAALPSYPPSVLLPHIAAMQGMLGGGMSPQSILATMDLKNKQSQHQQQQQQHQPSRGTGGKSGNASTRPFKAYPKEPLSLPLGYFGLPGMNPFPGLDSSISGQMQMQQTNSDDMYKQYRDYVIKMHQEQLQKSSGGVPLDKSPPVHKDILTTKLPASPTNVSSTSSSSCGGSVPTSPMVPVSSNPSNSTGRDTGVSTTTDPHHRPSGGSGDPTASKRKRLSSSSAPGGGDNKDQAYWERRRKNNDAAKRSRDSRRAKEDEIAIRAAFLEQENLKLRVEVTALKNETNKLRNMLYSPC